MQISRYSARVITFIAAAIPALSASAQATTLPVYDNEFKSGWQSWSWAKVEMPTIAGNDKPLKVQGDPWSALFLHHDAFSTSNFSKLTFYINGGAEGGQRLTVKLTVDGKALESSCVIEPKAKTWTIVEIPLSELSADNRTVDGLMLQADVAPYKPYYVTRIQFE